MKVSQNCLEISMYNTLCKSGICTYFPLLQYNAIPNISTQIHATAKTTYLVSKLELFRCMSSSRKTNIICLTIGIVE